MIIFWAILVSVSVMLGVGIWILGILYLGKKLNLTKIKNGQMSRENVSSHEINKSSNKIPVLNQKRLTYEHSSAPDQSGLMLTPILTIQDQTSIILIPIQGKFPQNKSTSILADHDGLVYFSLN